MLLNIGVSLYTEHKKQRPHQSLQFICHLRGILIHLQGEVTGKFVLPPFEKGVYSKRI